MKVPYSIHPSTGNMNGIIFNSPHSGTLLPESFLKQISINPNILLYSGDLLVDQLIEKTSNFGAHRFINHYARIYVDTNRNDNEIDPSMFGMRNTKGRFLQSDKVKRGFGVISRKSYQGQDIFSKKLPQSEIENRLNQVYYPVHNALSNLLQNLHQQFGYYLLLDCHSMPSYNFIDNNMSNDRQPDIIIGNLFKESCNDKITELIAAYLKKHYLKIAFNIPYAGGYNTKHYSNKADQRHCIQLEIKRSLYMDEEKLEPNAGFKKIQFIMAGLSHILNDNLDKLFQRKRAKS